MPLHHPFLNQPARDSLPGRGAVDLLLGRFMISGDEEFEEEYSIIHSKSG